MESDWIDEMMEEFTEVYELGQAGILDREVREMLLASYEKGYDEAMAASVRFGVRDE